jgi:hypothetical protein
MIVTIFQKVYGDFFGDRWLNTDKKKLKKIIHKLSLLKFT